MEEITASVSRDTDKAINITESNTLSVCVHMDSCYWEHECLINDDKHPSGACIVGFNNPETCEHYLPKSDITSRPKLMKWIEESIDLNSVFTDESKPSHWTHAGQWHKAKREAHTELMDATKDGRFDL